MPTKDAASSAKPLHRNLRIIRPLTDSQSQYTRVVAHALSPAAIPALRRRLLLWYEKHKRDLPWRRTNDPYRIWISEIMLQQTLVAAVIPYYERFLTLFPNPAALAAAR